MSLKLTPTLTHPHILYQDDYFVAINKPSGQLVHRSALDPSACVFAVQQLREYLGKYVYPIHRLDRPTSGVLLFALSPDWVKVMQSYWQNHTSKYYHALVRGWLYGDAYIDYPLRYQADKLTESHKQAENIQAAASSYNSITRFQAPFVTKRYKSARYSLIKLSLHTGRKHQLRRHLAHIRHPIIGDTTHGDGTQNAIARKYLGCEHLQLSCSEIRFVHPKTKQAVVITSPLSENFNQCISRLRSASYLCLE